MLRRLCPITSLASLPGPGATMRRRDFMAMIGGASTAC